MKYNFKGITVEELSYNLNKVKLQPNQRVDIKPQFSRQVRKSNENAKLNFIALSVKIATTEAEPKPFNLSTTVVGVFELENEPSAEEERAFVIEATKLLYPYLRTTVTALTAQAYISPLNLPVISGPIFPEDRDVYAFAPGNVN